MQEAQQLSEAPIGITLEYCREILQKLWHVLAPVAWEGYCEDGRGIIFIDASSYEKNGELGHYAYVGEAGSYFRNTLNSQWPHAGTAEAVSSYNPEHSVVFTFWWGKDERASCIRFDSAHLLAPPLIYEAVRLRPSEFC